MPARTPARARLEGRTRPLDEISGTPDNAHRDLDRAVAAAYGWPEDISEEDALAQLLALNLERAAAGR